MGARRFSEGDHVEATRTIREARGFWGEVEIPRGSAGVVVGPSRGGRWQIADRYKVAFTWRGRVATVTVRETEIDRP